MRIRLFYLLLTAALACVCAPASAAARHHARQSAAHATTATRHREHAVTRGHASAREHAVHARPRRSARTVKLVRASRKRPLRGAPAKPARRATRSEQEQTVDFARAGERTGISVPPTAESAADGAESAASSAPLPQLHNPKIHHLEPAEKPGQPAEAAPARESIVVGATPSAATRAASAAFVNKVQQQAQTPSAATRAIAAGAADEIAGQPDQQRADTHLPAPAQPALAVKHNPKAAYLTSRSMPAGPLVAAPSAAPHIPSVEEEVLTPEILPALYSRRGRLIVPPAMKGTHEILVHQNTMADSEGLTRIQDDADLARMRSTRLLVSLPQSAALRVDERLPGNRRFCRPWTEIFLANLARAHYARFHTPLQVNSAVRTVAFQERLIRTNGNAAPAEGLTASPHLTGQAVDLAKHGLSLSEIAWLRGYLMPLVQEGKIDVEEEFQQSCFHISVYKSYLPEAAPRRLIAEKSRHSAAALGAAIR